ncbi:hypothetical protein K239x_52170 [Planctomycetes bacterium K23_9]|uniref:Uncharacterized protein n=1 Tax=Stieleria marina TaxID=1930275 RepID=A0A517P1E8_9BACT|nr:hypothetical protein K239x_52170 [Planctomycetes bacterium K23_9]
MRRSNNAKSLYSQDHSKIRSLRRRAVGRFAECTPAEWLFATGPLKPIAGSESELDNHYQCRALFLRWGTQNIHKSRLIDRVLKTHSLRMSLCCCQHFQRER